MRMFTSLLWVLVTLAFGFDAVAQPCDLRAQATAEMHHAADEAMPCHDGMMMAEPTAPNDQPEHQKDTCCCAALLTNIVTVESVDLTQPLPGLVAWTSPLPDALRSIDSEYEPPPPRA